MTEGIEPPNTNVRVSFPCLSKRYVPTKEEAMIVKQEEDVILVHIERRDDYTTNPYFKMSFIFVSVYKNFALVSAFAQAGVLLDLSDRFIGGAYNQNEAAALETLIACKYDLNRQHTYHDFDTGTINGATLLMIACKEVWPDSVKRLLEAGVDPNIKILRMAIHFIGKFTILTNVEQRLKNKVGAKRKPYAQDRIKIVRLLLKYGPDPALPNTRSATA